MTYTSSLTSKGQITIPKELRDRVGLQLGKKASIRQLDDHSVVIEAPLSVEAIRKKIGPPSGDQPLTDSERLNLIARGLL